VSALPGYQVARALPVHFAAIREVERAAERQFPPEDLPRELRGQLTSDEELAAAAREELLWCALDARGEVVGFAIACRLPGGDLHLDEIDVRPAHQRRGVGAALVAAVRARAARLGCARLTLTTFRFVPWNQPWYERLGFVALEERALPPALRAIHDEEIARGLARERRVAMALELAP
jgi:GNAT superfamily N-acetyltransferase